MAIVGERPQTGVRIAIERPREGGPPWSYVGSAFVPEATFPVQVTVSEEGVVKVVLSPSADGGAAPSDLAEKIRLIVRAVYRQGSADGEGGALRSAPAFRIVRWRADQ